MRSATLGPTPGTASIRSTSSRLNRRHQFGRRQHRKNRQRKLGPDVLHLHQEVESALLASAQKTVQAERVLAHDLPDFEENFGANRGQPIVGAERDEDLVADAAALDQHGPTLAPRSLPVSVAIMTFSARAHDHRRAPRALMALSAAGFRAIVRWQSASARASAASLASSSDSSRLKARRTMNFTCPLSARP